MLSTLEMVNAVQIIAYLIFPNQLALAAGSTSCCPYKFVGGVHYKYVEDNSNLKPHLNCIDNCVYREISDAHNRYCFRPGKFEMKCEDFTGLLIDGGRGAFDSMYEVQSIPGCTSPITMPIIERTFLEGASAAYGNDTVYICKGGRNSLELECKSLNNNDTAWTDGPNFSEGGYAYGTFSSLDDRLVSIGGEHTSETTFNYPTTVQILDLKTNVWTLGPHDIPFKRSHHCTIPMSDNEVIMLGGKFSNKSFTNSVQRFNVDLGNSTNLKPLPIPNSDLGCGLLAQGKDEYLLVAGGSQNRTAFYYLNLREADGNWTALPKLPTDVADATMMVIDDIIYIVSDSMMRDQYFKFTHNGNIDTGSWSIADITYRGTTLDVVVPCTYRGGN